MTDEELLAKVRRLVDAGGDADDVLRAVVELLRPRFGHVAIAFREEDDWVVGPSAGDAGDAGEVVPIDYQGTEIAELRVSPSPPPSDRELLGRIAPLLAEHCLVGWDTQGESWVA